MDSAGYDPATVYRRTILILTDTFIFLTQRCARKHKNAPVIDVVSIKAPLIKISLAGASTLYLPSQRRVDSHFTTVHYSDF
jgi:hypothetical protein